MKRIVFVVSMFVAASSAMASPVAADQKTTSKGGASKTVALKPAGKIKVAPADEYFGRLKMSILGIRNTIKDLGAKVDFAPEKASGVMGSAALTEDALKDWERKYPADPWLPKSVFSLERLYAKIATDEGRTRAKATMAWLVGRYPATSFAKIGRAEIAAGQVGAPLAAAAQPAVPGAASVAIPLPERSTTP